MTIYCKFFIVIFFIPIFVSYCNIGAMQVEGIVQPRVESQKHRATNQLGRIFPAQVMGKSDQRVIVFIENTGDLPLQINISRANGSASEKNLALAGTGNTALPYRTGVSLPAEDLRVHVVQQHKHLDFGTVTIPAAIIKQAYFLLVNRSNISLYNNNGLLKECSDDDLLAMSHEDNLLSTYVNVDPSKKLYITCAALSLLAWYSLCK